MVSDLIIGLITGFVSGIASGYFVYSRTKRQEEKYHAAMFCENYLFRMLEKCEIYIPREELSYFHYIGDKDTEWGKAIYHLLDVSNPFSHDDIEMTEEQNYIGENVLIALNELSNWKKENKIR